MSESSATYHFLTVDNYDLNCSANDAITAFYKIEKDHYFRLKKFSRGRLPADGYSLLYIGYGLSVAYKRISAS